MSVHAIIISREAIDCSGGVIFMNEENISEIKITINMTREEYIKKSKTLNLLVNNSLGAVFIYITLLFITIWANVRLFAVFKRDFHSAPINWGEVAFDILFVSISILIFIFFLAAILFPYTYKDYFLLQKGELNYTAVFTKEFFLLYPNEVTDSDVLKINYSTYFTKGYSTFGIAFFTNTTTKDHLGRTNSKTIKYLFPACFFQKGQAKQIHKWANRFSLP